MKRLKEELGEVEHKIGEPCNECGTPLTDTHLCAAKEAAAKRLADAGATLRTEHGKFTAASATLAEAEGALETHRKAMHDPSALTAERAKLAEITNRIASLGAGATAFAVIFPEPDRTTMGQIAGDLAIDDARDREAALKLPQRWNTCIAWQDDASV